MRQKSSLRRNLTNVHYAVATIANDGTATYDTPVAVPGAVSLSLSAQGDSTPFYADNIVYYTSIANNGYEGDVEIAKIPESMMEDIFSYAKAANDLMYEDAGAEPVHFALMFQFEGDVTAKRHILYNCTATRPNIDGSTKEDSITPQTETITVNATTVYNAALSKDIVKAYLNEGDTGYSTFFSSVLQPTATAITT